MTTTTYSIHDYITAKRTGNETVLAWFKQFYSLLSKYARHFKSAALGMKAIWSNLKKGISLNSMLKRMVDKALQLAEGVTGKRMMKGDYTARDTYQMPTIRSRAGKHQRYSCKGRWSANSTSRVAKGSTEAINQELRNSLR